MLLRRCQRQPRYFNQRPSVLSDRHTLLRVKMAESDWQACPREILIQCFATQADYFDNNSADAACKAWHDAMLGVTELLTNISVSDGPVSNQTRLLHNFPNLQTIKIVYVAGSTQPYGNRQEVRVVPFMLWMLGHFCQIVKQNKLSNLRELHIQTACHPMMSLDSFTSLKKLLVLTVAGGEQEGETVYIIDHIVDLPRAITQLRFRHCKFKSAPSAGLHNFWSLTPAFSGSLRLTPEASKHLRALQHLDLSYLAVDLRGNFADMNDLHTLVLEESTVWVTPDLAFLRAAQALHTLNIRKATLKCHQSLIGISHLLAASPSMKRLDVTDCLDLLIRSGEYLQASAQLSALICSHCDFYAPDFDNVEATLHSAQASFFVPSTQIVVSKELPDLCTDWLVHLELNNMHKWPFAKASGHPGQTVSFCNLRTLHFEACCAFLRDTVQIPVAMKLTEFYLSVRLCNSILLADCTSLKTVGISYSGISRKARLPKSLSKLFWPNALTATPHSVFRSITSLQSLHLGHPSFVSLPQLPTSLTELDLSGSNMADLTSLPTLTNLQKLTLPAAPSSAVLQCLKQTVRLKHVAIVEREGRLSICLLQSCKAMMLVAS